MSRARPPLPAARSRVAGGTRLQPRLGVRTAMTLIELLTVIAVLAILAGLTMPAIEAARESARSCACTNNLKQIAMAATSHETARGALPHGGWSGGNAPTYRNGTAMIGKEQLAGWAFQLLPYLDEELLHRRPPEVAIATPIGVYFCPSRGKPRVLPPLDSPSLYPNDPRQGMYPLPQPLAHAGIDYASAYTDPTNLTRGTPRYQDFLDPPPQPDSSGCIIRLKITTNRNPPRVLAALIGRSDIRDGAGHTILVSEKRMNAAILGQYQLDDDQGYTSGWDFDVNRNASYPPERDYDADLLTLNNPQTHAQELRQLSQFGSAHPSGLHAAFADGSVRQISYSIEPLVFHRMGRRNDGKTLGE